MCSAAARRVRAHGRVGYVLAVAWVILGGSLYALQILRRLAELA